MSTRREELEERQWCRDNFTPGADEINPDWTEDIKDEARLMEQEELKSIGDLFLGISDDDL